MARNFKAQFHIEDNIPEFSGRMQRAAADMRAEFEKAGQVKSFEGFNRSASQAKALLTEMKAQLPGLEKEMLESGAAGEHAWARFGKTLNAFEAQIGKFENSMNGVKKSAKAMGQEVGDALGAGIKSAKRDAEQLEMVMTRLAHKMRTDLKQAMPVNPSEFTSIEAQANANLKGMRGTLTRAQNGSLNRSPEQLAELTAGIRRYELIAETARRKQTDFAIAENKRETRAIEASARERDSIDKQEFRNRSVMEKALTDAIKAEERERAAARRRTAAENRAVGAENTRVERAKAAAARESTSATNSLYGEGRRSDYIALSERVAQAQAGGYKYRNAGEVHDARTQMTLLRRYLPRDAASAEAFGFSDPVALQAHFGEQSQFLREQEQKFAAFEKGNAMQRLAARFTGVAPDGKNFNARSTMIGLNRNVTGVSRLMGYSLLGVGAAGALTGLVKGSIEQSMEANQIKVVLGGLINTYVKFSDVNGRAVNATEGYIRSVKKADELYLKIRDVADKSPLRTKELADYYMTAAPLAFRHGINEDEALQLISKFAIVGTTMHLRQTEISHDVRELMDPGGRYQNNRIGRVLGITKQERDDAMKNGPEAYSTFMQSKFAGMDPALKDFEQSFVTKWNTFLDKLQRLAMKVGDELIPALSPLVDNLGKSLDEWNHSGRAAEFAKSLGAMIASVGTILSGFVRFLAENLRSPMQIALLGIGALLTKFVAGILVEKLALNGAVGGFLGVLGLLVAGVVYFYNKAQTASRDKESGALDYLSKETSSAPDVRAAQARTASEAIVAAAADGGDAFLKARPSSDAVGDINRQQMNSRLEDYKGKSASWLSRFNAIQVAGGQQPFTAEHFKDMLSGAEHDGWAVAHASDWVAGLPGTQRDQMLDLFKEVSDSRRSVLDDPNLGKAMEAQRLRGDIRTYGHDWRTLNKRAIAGAVKAGADPKMLQYYVSGTAVVYPNGVPPAYKKAASLYDKFIRQYAADSKGTFTAGAPPPGKEKAAAYTTGSITPDTTAFQDKFDSVQERLDDANARFERMPETQREGVVAKIQALKQLEALKHEAILRQFDLDKAGIAGTVVYKSGEAVDPSAMGKLLTFSDRAGGDRSRLAQGLLADLGAVAGNLGLKLDVGTAISGHSAKTTSGNTSRHTKGQAVDIDMINGVSYRSNPKLFTQYAQQLQDELVRQGYTKNSENGNQAAVLFGFNDPARGGNHLNHVHISNTGDSIVKGGPTDSAKQGYANKIVSIDNQLAKITHKRDRATNKLREEMIGKRTELIDKLSGLEGESYGFESSLQQSADAFNQHPLSGANAYETSKYKLTGDKRLAEQALDAQLRKIAIEDTTSGSGSVMRLVELPYGMGTIAVADEKQIQARIAKYKAGKGPGGHAYRERQQKIDETYTTGMIDAIVARDDEFTQNDRATSSRVAAKSANLFAASLARNRLFGPDKRIAELDAQNQVYQESVTAKLGLIDHMDPNDPHYEDKKTAMQDQINAMLKLVDVNNDLIETIKRNTSIQEQQAQDKFQAAYDRTINGTQDYSVVGSMVRGVANPALRAIEAMSPAEVVAAAQSAGIPTTDASGQGIDPKVLRSQLQTAAMKSMQGTFDSGRVRDLFRGGAIDAVNAIRNHGDPITAFAGQMGNHRVDDAINRLLGGHGTAAYRGKLGSANQYADLAQAAVSLINWDPKKYGNEGSEIGGMIGGLIPQLGPFGSVIGSLAGGLLGSIFGRHTVNPADEAYKKRIADYLNSIDKKLNPIHDFFQNRVNTFQSDSMYLGGRALGFGDAVGSH